MNLGISVQMQTLRESFFESGYVVMKRAFSEQLLDWHTAEFAAFLLRSPEVNVAQRDGDRHREVAARRKAFHWHSAEVLQLAMHPIITDMLRALLLEEPFLLHVGTLNNEPVEKLILSERYSFRNFSSSLPSNFTD